MTEKRQLSGVIEILQISEGGKEKKNKKLLDMQCSLHAVQKFGDC